MSANDAELFSSTIRVENKNIYVDLKENAYGIYLKISERNRSNRNTLMIPSSGIPKLIETLQGLTTQFTPKTFIREQKPRIVNPRAVFVSNLAFSATDTDLLDHFRSHGCNATSAVILRRKRGKQDISSGFGVVEFESSEEALHAISALNESLMFERPIRCREDQKVDPEGIVPAPTVSSEAVATTAPKKKRAKRTRKPKSQEQAQEQAQQPEKAITERKPRITDPNRVIVSNIAWATTSEELAAFFLQCGQVVSAEVYTNREGRSRGNGVVEFSNPGAASLALGMAGQILHERALKVREAYVKNNQ